MKLVEIDESRGPRVYMTNKPSRIPRSELFVIIFLLITLVFGTFFPPETYFAPQDFTVEGAATREIGFPFARYLNLLIIIWLSYLLYSRQAIFIRAVKRNFLPILFAIWAIASSILTDDPIGSFNRGMKMGITIVFTAYLVERAGDTRTVIRWITIAGGISIAASTLAVILLPSYSLTTLIGYEGAWRGATSHKNGLGGVAAQMVIIALFAYSAKIISTRYFIILASLSTITLIMSTSGTSLVSLFITSFVVAAFSFVSKLRTISEKFIVLSCFLIIIPSGLIIQQYSDEILIMLGRSPDLTGRGDIWRVVWDLILENPIWGYGNNFWATDSRLRNTVWIELGWAAPHAHNMYLDIWFQLGIIGLMLAVIIIFTILVRIAKLLVAGMPFVEIIWPAFMLTMLFRGFTETSLVEPGGSGWFIIILAYASTSRFQSQRMTKRRSTQSSRIPIPETIRTPQ